MLDKTDIANLALSKIGVSLQVTNFDTDLSLQAKIIRRHFSMAHETLLGKAQWGFATKVGELALVNTLYINGYHLYNYRFPVDCITPRQIAENGAFPAREQYEDQKIHWEELYDDIGQIIQTTVQNAWVKYTGRIDENSSMPVFYARALSAQLAWDIAPQIVTQNFPKIRDALFLTVQNEITLGISEDLGRRPQKLDSHSPFYRARFE